MISFTTIVSVILLVSLVCSVHAFGIGRSGKKGLLTKPVTIENGIVEYIGNTLLENKPRWSTCPGMSFRNISGIEILHQRFRFFIQPPWKKIKGKVVLNIKLGGSLSIESSAEDGRFLNFGSPPADPSLITSLADFQTIMTYAAHDPRVVSVLLQIQGFSCGYAKLQEAKRMINYYLQSGKRITAYADAGSEKEIYLALGCSEFFVPPDGSIDLRGFAGSAAFVRGVFDKLGIEPQVQRIGKYKSFGDTFNRTQISDAQREVVSSLLMESSDFWVDSVAEMVGKDPLEIKQLWNDSMIKTTYDFKDMVVVYTTFTCI
jgi:protease IV